MSINNINENNNSHIMHAHLVYALSYVEFKACENVVQFLMGTAGSVTFPY